MEGRWGGWEEPKQLAEHRRRSSRVTVGQGDGKRQKRGMKRNQGLVKSCSSWQCWLETSLLRPSAKEKRGSMTDVIVMTSPDELQGWKCEKMVSNSTNFGVFSKQMHKWPVWKHARKPFIQTSRRDVTVLPLRQQQSHKTTAQVGGGGDHWSLFWPMVYGRECRCFHTLQKRNSTKDKSPEPYLNSVYRLNHKWSPNIIHPKSKVSRKKTPKSAHLFRLTAGGSQQERIQHVFPSQEEAVAVLIQVDGGQGELAVMAAEDGRAVGGEQICEREGGDTDELWGW